MVVTGQTFKDIADAIREKDGSTGTMKISQMAQKIRDIPQGGGGEPSVALRCYDYEGTIVGEYTKDEVMAMTQLPACPDHTDIGLTSQGWNWTLAKVKGQVEVFGGPVYIGAVYITDNGATRLVLDVDILEFYLGFGINGTATIDWGDGSATDTVTGTSTSASSTKYTKHTYAQEGRYTISISGGQIVFNGANSAPYLLTLTGANITSSDKNIRSMMGMLRGIYTGSNITTYNSYGLCAVSLDFVTLHNNCAGYASQLANFYLNFCVAGKSFSLRGGYTQYIVPDNISLSIGEYTDVTYYNCPPFIYPEYKVEDGTTVISNNRFENSRYKRIKLPDTVRTIGNYAFQNCYSLRVVNIPSGVTSIGNTVFYYCYGLREVNIPSSVTSIGSQVFSNCYGLNNVDFSKHTAIPTLANYNAFTNIKNTCQIIVPDALYNNWIKATNWSNANVTKYIVKKSESRKYGGQ